MIPEPTHRPHPEIHVPPSLRRENLLLEGSGASDTDILPSPVEKRWALSDGRERHLGVTDPG